MSDEDVIPIRKFSVVPNENKVAKEKITIKYTDGSEEEFICDYFGSSTEIPKFLIIGNTDEAVPSHVINSDLIKRLTTQLIHI